MRGAGRVDRALSGLIGFVVVALLTAACAGGETAGEPGGSTATTATTAAPTPGLPAVPVLSMFGDSTALMTSWGLLTELTRTDRATFAEGFTGLGCSVLRTPERRIAGEVAAADPTCNGWAEIWSANVAANQPDVVVVQTGSWDVADRKLPGEDEWRSPGDPTFDAFAMAEMMAAVDVLSAHGAVVVWLTSPEPGANAYESERVRAFDPAPRHRSLNRLIRQLPDQRPGAVTVVDLAAWIEGVGPAEDARLRSDGIHFVHDTSVEACERYLCDAVLAAARELRSGPAPDPTGAAGDPIVPMPGPGEPDGRAQARAALLGRPLYEAGLGSSAAGWRIRVDTDETFDATPAGADEIVVWWQSGVVVDVR